MINVDEKSTKNVKIKKILRKYFRKRKEFEYNDIRERQRKEFECANIYDVLY